MIYTIKNRETHVVISRNAQLVDSFSGRFMGLMFRPDIHEDEALIFYNAPSIHMFFMRFPIDVLFLDSNKRIIRICDMLRPWKAVYCPPAHITIELPAQRAAEKSLKVGDNLELVPHK